MLSIAAWKDQTLFIRSCRVDVKRGQLVFSVRGLARRWKTNNRVVSLFIRLLESAGMIDCDRSNHSWMVISICNYDKFQSISVRNQKIDDFDPYSIGLLPKFEEEQEDEEQDKNEQTGHHKRHPNKKDNNIINKQVNSSSSSVREENLKYCYDLKNNAKEIEDIAKLLKCESQRVQSLLDDFIIEAVDEKHENAARFRKHFISWSRINLEINDKNGDKKSKPTGRGKNDDRFSPRRGTDPGSHAPQDFKGKF